MLTSLLSSQVKEGSIVSPHVSRKKRTSAHIPRKLPSQAEQLENNVQGA